MRNESGEYKGVIEVTQEITEIRSLQGERKIPDWENLTNFLSKSSPKKN
ncbi:hypothetical protein TRIP_D120040 [uncultured Paludibacter sp.]|uniref:Uncharacterized protein n=1 Tax=uncultured Paludibacter sp. TaxID=497635 RepID=A0A653A5S0_9BACT|nr:hypothetical protein TRIP_D120040 [uncultured Paludibacter sp.]